MCEGYVFYWFDVIFEDDNRGDFDFGIWRMNSGVIFCYNVYFVYIDCFDCILLRLEVEGVVG